jgi:hypothetical protein
MICQRLSRPRVLLLAVLSLSLTLSASASAGTRHARTHARAKAPARLYSWPRPNVAAPTGPGLIIAIDPVTHLPIQPTEEQKRAIQAQRSQDALLAPAMPLQVRALPGGGEIVDLNGAYRSFSIARRDARGRIVTDCAPDAEAARKLLARPAPSASAPEDK